MSDRVKVGVFGVNRGLTMIDVMSRHPDAELVAVCDFNKPALKTCEHKAKEAGVPLICYQDFDAFLDHDMDAVVLANYATEHVPYAVRLLDSGRHVCSEVLACQTLAEAVQLVEAVERSGRVYGYAENYCYFRGTQEMQKIYRRGDLGEFLHGEGEYVHDCQSIWTDITYGQKDHWRNWISSTFYCTHSIGPILKITGTRPVRLTAYETPNINKRKFGSRSGDGATIVCQMSNGAVAKFLPWCNFRREPGAVWYAVYGDRGMAETDRWGDGFDKINVYIEGRDTVESYKPDFPLEDKLSKSIGGHGGSDFFTMHFFLQSILGRTGDENLIDVYSALDMTLPGILGYKSICEGNIPIDVPDMRIKSIREKYRNDNWSLDPNMAGPGQPDYSSSFGPVEVPDALYEAQTEDYEKRLSK
jgi:predicted dehydrogenase